VGRRLTGAEADPLRKVVVDEAHTYYLPPARWVIGSKVQQGARLSVNGDITLCRYSAIIALW
jgi:hypothetical protein